MCGLSWLWVQERFTNWYMKFYPTDHTREFNVTCYFSISLICTDNHMLSPGVVSEHLGRGLWHTHIQHVWFTLPYLRPDLILACSRLSVSGGGIIEKAGGRRAGLADPSRRRPLTGLFRSPAWEPATVNFRPCLNHPGAAFELGKRTIDRGNPGRE